MIASFPIGFVTSLSLIVAIGAQNAFVLRQGIRREHVLPVALVCAVSDALLIGAGIAGLGVVLTASPGALSVVRLGGAAFLLCYGLLAARRALRPRGMAPADRAPSALGGVLLTCLGLTYLNPHVYLDTVVMLGALANQHGPAGRWGYGAGAVSASLVWFLGLGFGARRLAPLFARPRAWRVLDAAIACVMFSLGGWLAIG